MRYGQKPSPGDDPFFIVLWGLYGLVITLGGALAFYVHAWSSIPIFLISFSGIIVGGPYTAVMDRIPQRRLILWPIRMVVCVLTLGLPFSLWIVLGSAAPQVLSPSPSPSPVPSG